MEDADDDLDLAAALGDPEVSGAPVETDVLVVAEAREPLDRLEDFDGAGDCSAKLVAEGVGLAGGLTVAGISLESISVIFLPAMLWQSKVFLRSSTTLALMWTVPLMTPSAVCDGLDSLGDSSKNSQPLTTKTKLGALQV